MLCFSTLDSRINVVNRIVKFTRKMNKILVELGRVGEGEFLEGK